MPVSVQRRRFLALCTGVATALAGCQSISALNSRVPVEIHISNSTDDHHEVHVQLRSTSEEVDDQIGEGFVSEAQTIEILSEKVPPATYTLRVILDEVEPATEKEVIWEITEKGCSHHSTITITSREATTDLWVNAQSCENT